MTGSYPNPTLNTGSVTTNKLADAAVTDDKLAGSIAPSKIATDTSNRFVSDAEKTAWSSKQAAISGTSNMTLNNLTASGHVILNNDTGNAGVTLKSKDDLAAAYTLTLPANDGNNLDVLQTDGTGVLSWVAIPSAPVASVAGKTGVVALAASDISSGTFDSSRIADNAVTSAKILNGSIADEDISSSAAIADSKLGPITTPGKVSGDAITGGTLVGTSGFAGSSGVSLKSAGSVSSELRFYNTSNNYFVGFKAPNPLNDSTTWVLPAASGSNGQVLATDASNNLSWMTPTGGTVTAVTGGTGLTGGTITGSGTLALASPMPALDGAALTNINAVKLQSRNVSNTAPTNGQILKWIDNAWTPAADAGDSVSTISGGINIGDDTATNAGILASIESNNMRFRRLHEGSGIELTQNTNDVTIAIGNGGVGSAALADGAVTSGKIANATIATEDISDGAITDVKIATISSAGKVSGDAITTGTIGGNSAFGGSGGVNTTGAISTAASPISGYGNFVVKASSTATTELKFNARNNVNYTSFKSPDTLSSDVTYTLPSSGPASDGQVLSATTAGALSWLSLPTLVSLLPSQTGQNGKVLQTDGSAVSWVALPTAPVASVAGKTGVVVLDADDVTATASKLWLSSADKTKLDGITAGADMLKSTYDTDTNGKADDADKLGGQAASYYTNASNVASGTLAYARLPVGITANTVAAGDDARFSNARAPSGAAGGDLTGSYPNPTLKSSATADADRAVSTDHIKDGAITTGKLAADAVDSNKILNATITTADLADSAITDVKIAGITTAGKVSGDAITSGSLGGTSGFAGTGGVYLQSAGSTGSDLRFFSNNNTNYLGLRAPNGVTSNTTWTLPLGDGTSGQVLSTGGNGTLSWATPNAGMVSSQWSTSGSNISYSGGNVGIGTTSPGYPLTIHSTLPKKALTLQQTSGTKQPGINFNVDGSDLWQIYADNPAGNKLRFENGGNGIPITLSANSVGINTSSPGSSLQVNGNAVIGYSVGTAGPTNGLAVSGNVGIGTTNPTSALTVVGAARNASAILNSTATVDFATGNLQYTNASCGTFNLNNLKDGGSYSFILKGTTSATCVFNAYADAGTTALTMHLPLDHGATTASKHTMYVFLVVGSDVYASWIPGL